MEMLEGFIIDYLKIEGFHSSWTVLFEVGKKSAGDYISLT